MGTDTQNISQTQGDPLLHPPGLDPDPFRGERIIRSLGNKCCQCLHEHFHAVAFDQIEQKNFLEKKMIFYSLVHHTRPGRGNQTLIICALVFFAGMVF